MEGTDNETLQAIRRVENRIDRLWHLVTMDKDRMWDTGDVAAYLGVSETQVRTLAKNNTTFPQELRADNGKGQTQPRWDPDEIKTWMRRPEHRVSRAS